MKKRLCPVCDSEMKWGHFCFGCRQWIREPKIVEVNYYLNERHPKGETDCLYHNGPKAAAAAERTKGKKAVSRKPAGTGWKPAAEKKQPKKAATGKTVVLIVVVIYMALMFLLPLVGSILSAATRFF